MASFEVVFLTPTFVPVASGLTASLYVNPPSGLGPSQIASYIATQTSSASGVTDVNGAIYNVTNIVQGDLYIATLSGTLYSPTYSTAPTLGSGVTAGNMYIPMQPQSTLCQVYGYVLGQDSSPQVGVTVTANLNASGPVIATNLILSQTSSTTTNANGYWSLELIPNDQISEPKHTLYNFIFQSPALAPQLAPFYAFGVPIVQSGPSISRVVWVPNQASVNFASLV